MSEKNLAKCFASHICRLASADRRAHRAQVLSHSNFYYRILRCVKVIAIYFERDAAITAITAIIDVSETFESWVLHTPRYWLLAVCGDMQSANKVVIMTADSVVSVLLLILTPNHIFTQVSSFRTLFVC